MRKLGSWVITLFRWLINQLAGVNYSCNHTHCDWKGWLIRHAHGHTRSREKRCTWNPFLCTKFRIIIESTSMRCCWKLQFASIIIGNLVSPLSFCRVLLKVLVSNLRFGNYNMYIIYTLEVRFILMYPILYNFSFGIMLPSGKLT